MDKIHPLIKLLDLLTKYFIFLLFFIYLTGFLIWNFYLFNLGFSEFEMIQTKFLSAGILFFVLFFFVFSLAWLIYKLLSYHNKYEHVLKKFKFAAILVGLIIYFLILFIFSVLFFPKIPFFLGGAEPQIQSIIGPEEQIKLLPTFAIATASPQQTENLCIAYENNDSFIALVFEQPEAEAAAKGATIKYRALKFRKDIITGFGSIKGDEKVEEQKKECEKFLSQKMFFQSLKALLK